MLVRHLVAQHNVSPNGRVIAPERVRHGVLRAGRIYALAGEIDPETHLNLDFPDHQLGTCVVVADLEVGAPAMMRDDSYLYADTGPSMFSRFGAVNVGARRTAWLKVLQERRSHS